VAEALEDFPPSPDLTMRANAVRVIAGMYWITGTTRFPRGWVRPAMTLTALARMVRSGDGGKSSSASATSRRASP
jgi:hypothetical protein